MSRNWLAKNTEEKGVCVWSKIAHCDVRWGLIFFCGISWAWKWWWRVEGMKVDGVDDFQFKLQKSSSKVADCDVSIFWVWAMRNLLARAAICLNRSSKHLYSFLNNTVIYRAYSRNQGRVWDFLEGWKKGKKMLKKSNIFENLGKNIQNLKIFRKRAGDLHVTIARNKLLEKDLVTGDITCHRPIFCPL